MEIVLVRHGQPEWLKDGLNVVDPPLTDLGHRQAALTAGVLGRERFDEVIVSPLQRARQTVAPLLSALAACEVVEPFLEEIREPNWHGTPAEISAKAYERERSVPGDHRWDGIEGGEPTRDFVERVRAGATAWLGERGIYRSKQMLPTWHIDEPDRRIAMVAHAGTNGVLLCLLLGLDPVPWEWDRFRMNHASITRFDAIRQGDEYLFGVRRLSDVEHFGPSERTS
jgi:2,3-bisphosphoglycerate-dependent phosphoglycerate mutase